MFNFANLLNNIKEKAMKSPSYVMALVMIFWTVLGVIYLAWRLLDAFPLGKNILKIIKALFVLFFFYVALSAMGVIKMDDVLKDPFMAGVNQVVEKNVPQAKKAVQKTAGNVQLNLGE